MTLLEFPKLPKPAVLFATLGALAGMAGCSHDGDLDALREAFADRDPANDAGTPAAPPPPPEPTKSERCRIVSPEADVLVQADDVETDEDGLQAVVRVETDATGAMVDVELEIEGPYSARLQVPAEAASSDDKDSDNDSGDRYAASFEVTLDDGDYTVTARCGDGASRKTSELRALTVDTVPCVPSIAEPAAGTVLTAFDDRDGAEGLQFRITGELKGSDCSSYALHECDAGAPEPGSFVDRRDGRVTTDATLTTTGEVELCLTARDAGGNLETARLSLVHRVCDDAAVLCEADRVCHEDTDANPMFCGASCSVCPGPSAGRGAASCVDGACALQCDDGYVRFGDSCVFRPSCKGLASDCNGESCCSFDAINEGDDIGLRVQRGYDRSGKSTGILGWVPEDESLAVTVNAFELDRYEVTVGRFRTFLDEYQGWLGEGSRLNPRGGQGQHEALPASGWQGEWSGLFYPDVLVGAGPIPLLPADRADFTRRIGACTPATWTDTPGDNETLPINCVNFFEAFLFCLYEGGRLPTEAEWIVASAGGRQQRAFPWSDPPSDDSVSASRAAYNGTETQGPEPVGSFPSGAGRWGTMDLGGNLFEWTRDGVGADFAEYPAGPSNPVELAGDTSLRTARAARGGSYKFDADRMRSTYRQRAGTEVRINDLGFRCAYPARNDN